MMDEARAAEGDTPAFPLSLVLEYRRNDANAWSSGCWQVIAALAGQLGATRSGNTVTMHRDNDGEQVLCGGYQLQLHRDDAESYYCNLMGRRPSLFVVCREEDGQRPRPTLVTASYGEAASYTEVDDNVYAVPIPPQIYRRIEAYVLEHYVPQKPRKRKRDDWKRDERRA